MNFVAGCVLMCYDLANNDKSLHGLFLINNLIDFEVYDF